VYGFGRLKRCLDNQPFTQCEAQSQLSAQLYSASRAAFSLRWARIPSEGDDTEENDFGLFVKFGSVVARFVSDIDLLLLQAISQSYQC
jgi:hypothetical protein